MLIVKPSYKPGWFFVGGMVNAHESPLQAALRETEEESGIRLQPEQLRFLGVRYGLSKRSGDDYVHFLFWATIGKAQIQQMRVNDQEVEDIKWVPVKNKNPEILDHVYMLFRQLQQNASPALYADQDTLFIPAPDKSFRFTLSNS